MFFDYLIPDHNTLGMKPKNMQQLFCHESYRFIESFLNPFHNQSDHAVDAIRTEKFKIYFSINLTEIKSIVCPKEVMKLICHFFLEKII